jgi:hypothetical protein
VCSWLGDDEVQLVWGLARARRPDAGAYLWADEVADAMDEVVRLCSYRSTVIGVRRVGDWPVWLVVGKIEAFPNFERLCFDGIHPSRGGRGRWSRRRSLSTSVWVGSVADACAGRG